MTSSLVQAARCTSRAVCSVALLYSGNQWGNKLAHDFPFMTHLGKNSETLTNSTSSTPGLPSALAGGDTVSSKAIFFPDFFFFFLHFVCTPASGRTASLDMEGCSSWTTAGLCGVSDVSMCSTRAAEGISKLNAKEPCSLKDLGPFAASELSGGRTDSSTCTGTLWGRKLNLKLLSLWDQSGLSALREAQSLDLGLISVRGEKGGGGRGVHTLVYLTYLSAKNTGYYKKQKTNKQTPRRYTGIQLNETCF